jgi:hypothetical protein
MEVRAEVEQTIGSALINAPIAEIRAQLGRVSGQTGPIETVVTEDLSFSETVKVELTNPHGFPMNSGEVDSGALETEGFRELGLVAELNPERVEFTRRNFEPFYRQIENLLHSGQLGTEDQSRGETNWQQLLLEWDGADEPRSLIVQSTTSVLMWLLRNHLALDELEETIGAQRAQHVDAAITAVVSLNNVDQSVASTIAALVGEELSQSLGATPRPRTKVATAAGWIEAGAKAGMGGALAGAGIVNLVVPTTSLLRYYPIGLTEGWAAIICALVATLGTFAIKHLTNES